MWTLAGGLGVILLVLFFHASALVVFSEILCCGLSVKAQDYAFLAKANVVLFWLVALLPTEIDMLKTLMWVLAETFVLHEIGHAHYTERVHDHIGAMVHRMLRF